MKINISQKLGLSAALVVSIVGCFSESAEAALFRVSGSSDRSVDAEFNLDTDKPFSEAIENFFVTENDRTLAFDPPQRGRITASEFTNQDLEDLNNQLNENSNNERNIDVVLGNVVQYKLTFDELPSYELKLFLPFGEDDDLKDSLISSPAAFDNPRFIGDETIGGILIRESLNDEPIVDLFGVGGGTKFSVEEIKNIPEPTTAAGLLAVLAVGGLSLRKGDKLKGRGKSDRRVKSKAII